MGPLDQISAKLRGVGYIPRRPELMALGGALLGPPPRAGARALLLEGPPGAGKSALAEATATAWNAPLVVAQLHAWTDADELFVGVDVAAAVAGDADSVRQDGVLALAAREAEEHPLVVLLLDEVDKAPERAEALLLDWLQSGRVPLAPGRHLQTRLDRLLVILTSNGQRDLSDALLRRVRRVAVGQLPVGTQEDILATRTLAPKGLVRVAWKLAREVVRADDAIVSLQEGERLLGELRLAEAIEDCRVALAGWAARGEAGRAVAASINVAPLWGELVKARREGSY